MEFQIHLPGADVRTAYMARNQNWESSKVSRKFTLNYLKLKISSMTLFAFLLSDALERPFVLFIVSICN